MSNSKKSRRQYDLEYKKRIVQEDLQGEVSAHAIAEREGLERGQIYSWKVQLENRSREARIETIAETEGVSLDQARQIRELEEELEASQKKVAQLVLENDLLKKIQPDSQYPKKSSGYIETKQHVAFARDEP